MRCAAQRSPTRSIRCLKRLTCTVTTRDCRSSVNFVLRAYVKRRHCTHPAPRGASDVWRSTEHEVHSRSRNQLTSSSRGSTGPVHVCLRVSNVRVITSRRAPSVGPQRRTKKTQKSRKSRSSLYRRRFREALTSRHRLRASLLAPRPRRIHRIRQLSQSRLHQLAHERIF